MPRIAHVISTPQGVGGAEKVLAALVDEGSRRDWDQLVLNPFARDERELAAMCRPARFAAFPCSHIWCVPALRRWLSKQLSSFGPDIVHVHLFHAMVAVASLRRLSSVRILTHHHGDLFMHQRRYVRRLMDRAGGRRYDVVVAVSESVQRSLIEGYGYPTDGVVRIDNGWVPPLRPPSARVPGPPTIICVANLRPEKRHSDLLQAFDRVRAEIPEARLSLVGSGPLTPDLHEQVNRLSLEDSVDFLGAVDDVWPHLARADVFAIASSYETLGIAVLEAMAAGLPVVASAVGALPQIVEEGTTGLLVPPGDTEGFADALLSLLRDPSKRERLGVAAKETAARFDMRVTTANYFSLYERVLAGSARSGAEIGG